jgi:hypothetical protein
VIMPGSAEGGKTTKCREKAVDAGRACLYRESLVVDDVWSTAAGRSKWTPRG